MISPATTPPSIDCLAQELGVSVASLNMLGVERSDNTWRYPERDAAGQVVGWNRRFDDGTKRAVKGGHRGLCYAVAGDHPLAPIAGATAEDPILVVEGMSDTAAGTDLGFVTVGRSTAKPGRSEQRCLSEILGGRHVVVVAEHEDSGVGLSGAAAVADALVPRCGAATGGSVKIVEPPDGVKDLRTWVVDHGADRAELNAAIRGVEPRRAVPGGDPAVVVGHAALPDDLPAVMPFHASLLPDSLRPWVEDIAERIQCPPDFPAVAAMVCLGAVVGRKVAIRPKRYDDWAVVPNLWGAVIGRPSIMKTPALAEPLGVLAEFEAEARSRYESELDSHNADELLRDARLKQARKELDAAVRAGEDVQAAAATLSAELKEKGRGPTRQRYVVNDSTVEKTGELLAENPNGLLVFRDELTGFLKSLDKDGQECARAFYLEAWNGTGRFTYDRIGRGTLDIEACCVSVLGGIQPGPLSGYLAAARNGGRGDDGLMQRFQLAVWPDPSGTWRHVDRTPDALARREARETYRRLDTATAGEVGAVAAFKGEIPSLRFDDAAQACFDAWRTKLERRLRSDLPLAMESALGKYRSLVPSLALLIHLADSQNGGAVGPVALERALRWADYLESHSARVYASATQPEVAAAKSVLRKIKGGQLACPFTLRDVYRNAWSGLTTKAQAEAAVELLVDYDWLIAEPVATGGRPKTRYRPVHPPDKTDKCPLPSVLSGAEGVQGGEKSMDPSSPTFKPPESSVAFV